MKIFFKACAIVVGLILGWMAAASPDAVGDVANPPSDAPNKEWNQWGGTPERNNVPVGKDIVTEWNVGKFDYKTGAWDPAKAKNIKWVAKLGSQTYGNPVVSQGRVLVGTNNESPRDPQHEGDRSVLYCLDEKTGDFLWQLVVPKLASGKVNDWEGLGLMSAPRVEGNRVYLVTSRCEVICLDLNGMTDGNQGFQDEAQYVVGPGKAPATIGPKDADIIWVYDMMDELGVFPHNASNSSPLIIGDLVYVCTSNGQDWTHVNIPSPLSPSFIALNKHTGELAAEDNAGIGPRIFHGQWTSASAGVVNGRKQVFFGGGDGWLYAFKPEPVHNAEEDLNFLEVIWKVDSNPPEYKMKDGRPIKYPDAEGPNEIIATPVFYKNRVYSAHGQDPEHGEGVGRLLCVDPTKKGDVTDSAIIWEYRGIHRSISTVSIDPETDLLFVGDFSGYVHCLDANTGELYWTHDMKAHMWGSTFVADGKVYLGDEDGDFIILTATKEKKVISETNLGAPIYSTPIVANGVLYVGTQTHLYAIHDEARAQLTTDQPTTIQIKP
jgi:outer membrane protein assembly factor BamB